jgi:Flp pilus assembly pilin Flp
MIARKLWDDDKGFVVSIELILISTIAVIGLVAGLTAVRDAVVSELSDVAGAVSDLNQSYSYNGTSSPTSSTAGSNFADSTDSADAPGDPVGAADNCIVFTDAPTDEGT